MTYEQCCSVIHSSLLQYENYVWKNFYICFIFICDFSLIPLHWCNDFKKILKKIKQWKLLYNQKMHCSYSCNDFIDLVYFCKLLLIYFFYNSFSQRNYFHYAVFILFISSAFSKLRVGSKVEESPPWWVFLLHLHHLGCEKKCLSNIAYCLSTINFLFHLPFFFMHLWWSVMHFPGLLNQLHLYNHHHNNNSYCSWLSLWFSFDTLVSAGFLPCLQFYAVIFLSNVIVFLIFCSLIFHYLPNWKGTFWNECWHNNRKKCLLLELMAFLAHCLLLAHSFGQLFGS